VAKGGKAGVAWPYTGRRVSSLVPWGGSEEPEMAGSHEML
jgi:hypothetical protein